LISIFISLQRPSYPMDTVGSLAGGKAAGPWSWPLTSIYCRHQCCSYISTPLYVFVAWCLFNWAQEHL
jgi:hypothetical protein